MNTPYRCNRQWKSNQMRNRAAYISKVIKNTDIGDIRRTPPPLDNRFSFWRSWWKEASFFVRSQSVGLWSKLVQSDLLLKQCKSPRVTCLIRVEIPRNLCAFICTLPSSLPPSFFLPLSIHLSTLFRAKSNGASRLKNLGPLARPPDVSLN